MSPSLFGVSRRSSEGTLWHSLLHDGWYSTFCYRLQITVSGKTFHICILDSIKKYFKMSIILQIHFVHYHSSGAFEERKKLMKISFWREKKTQMFKFNRRYDSSPSYLTPLTEVGLLKNYLFNKYTFKMHVFEFKFNF